MEEKYNFPVRLDYWQSCIETWIEIFKTMGVNNTQKIIDLCPGWAPKIEIALAGIGFSGEVLAIDNSQSNIKLFKSITSQYRFQFNLTTKSLNFFNPEINLRGADLIIGNHIIDDLIFDNLFGEKKAKIYQDPKTFRKMLNNLSYKIFEEEGKRILKVLTLIPKNCFLVLSQYLGYQEKIYSIETFSRNCNRLFFEIQKKLTRSGFEDKKILLLKTFKNKRDFYFSIDDLIVLKKLV